MTRLFRPLNDDRGIAMVVVLMAVVIVTVMGSTLVISGVRDLDSSTSVQRSSSALGIAEAAVQHAAETIKVGGPGPIALGDCRPDQKIDPNGQKLGQWMNPDNPKVAPVYDPLKPTTHCGPFQGWIGTGLYDAFVIAIDPIDLPTKRKGVYRVIATGVDKRENPVRPGARTVEQNLSVAVLDLPFALYAKSGSNFGGSPTILNESLYSEGTIYWRSKIKFDPPQPGCPYSTSCDTFYGYDPSDPTGTPGVCRAMEDGDLPCPSAVHSTSVINEGNGGGGGQNGPIHPPSHTDQCEFPYDRDTDGSGNRPWTGPPAQACVNAIAEPPYETSSMIKDWLPFDPTLPDEDTYQDLKALAKATGTYCKHTASSTLNIPPGNAACNAPAAIESLETAGEKFFVLYIEITGSGDVAIKRGWGPQNQPPSNSDCDGSSGIIVVRGGNISWQNNVNWWGAVFAPEGEFGGSGTGGDAWLIGTVYAKTIGNTGNIRFQMNDCWLDTIPGPFYTVKRLRWHEDDR